MKQRCLLKAPAKINMHLQVGALRSDGYHDLKSLMLMVSLFDEIVISSLKTGNQCEIDGSFDCKVEDNLLYKAWECFCDAAGKSFSTGFRVIKRIPAGAGLGGGSSDAAAVLRGMNLLYETGFSDGELMEIAGGIGSDVPFFIAGPAAVVEGRGDIIRPESRAEVYDIVIAKPDFSINTSGAYALLDKIGKKSGFADTEKLLKCYHSRFKDVSIYENDFYEVMKEEFPKLSAVKKAFQRSGAVFSSMTGSGSAFFGLFRSENDADRAFQGLKSEFKFVQKIKSLDRIPYAILE